MEGVRYLPFSATVPGNNSLVYFSAIPKNNAKFQLTQRNNAYFFNPHFEQPKEKQFVKFHPPQKENTSTLSKLYECPPGGYNTTQDPNARTSISRLQKEIKTKINEESLKLGKILQLY